jgi:hypothetical protein
MCEENFLYADFVYRDLSFSREFDLEVYFTNYASLSLYSSVSMGVQHACSCEAKGGKGEIISTIN